MKETLLCLLLLLLFSTGSFTQNAMADKGLQLVYFTDGSIVKGIILSYQTNEALVMKVAGEEVVLPADKVLYIVRGRIAKRYEQDLQMEKPKYEYAFRERGIYNVSSLSLNTGSNGEGTVVGLGIQHAIGYQFNRWIGAGAGAGIDVYGFNAEKAFIWLFGDVRGYLRPQKVTPFYAFQMGYGFLDDQRIRSAKGGMLIYPAVGVRLSGKSGANWSMDVGYKYQESELQYDWWDGFEIQQHRYHRYVFRVGLTF